jgi:micrococcal nuclease
LTYGKDRFGRTTAMVGTTDGRGVNAEIVRAGMAPLIPADAQTPAPPDLGAAAQEALVNKRGMHSPDIGCTVPGQVKALSEQVAKIPATPAPDMTTVDLSNSANSATDARMAAEELDSEFAQTRQDAVWIILDPAERAQLRAQVQSARDQAAARETVLRTATNIAVNQDTTRTSTQREAAHIARVLASIRRAEQARAAEAARRVAAARRAQAEMAQARADAAQSKRDKQQQDSSSSGSDPTSSDSTGSDSAGGSSSSGKRSSGRSGSGRSGQSSSG